MGDRSVRALSAAWWWATLAAALLWWAPAIALMATRLVGRRLRIRAAMGLGRALVAAGWPEGARQVYRAEAARADRRMRALRGRQGR